MPVKQVFPAEHCIDGIFPISLSFWNGAANFNIFTQIAIDFTVKITQMKHVLSYLNFRTLYAICKIFFSNVIQNKINKSNQIRFYDRIVYFANNNRI